MEVVTKLDANKERTPAKCAHQVILGIAKVANGYKRPAHAVQAGFKSVPAHVPSNEFDGVLDGVR